MSSYKTAGDKWDGKWITVKLVPTMWKERTSDLHIHAVVCTNPYT